MTEKQVIVFIDAQNVYKSARDAFFGKKTPHEYGSIDPIAFARLICSHPAPRHTYKLEQVRIYSGRPDATKQPKAYAAHMRQCSAWRKGGAKISARSLLYPTAWPKQKPFEKGIDVQLAIDFISLALDGDYDVGVIASTDSDLRPALEFVWNRLRDRDIRAEAAAWRSGHWRRRLSLPGKKIWCHWMNRTDYDAVADLTDYNIQAKQSQSL